MVFMPHWPIPHKITPTRVDLAPMLALMERLGNPHLKLPPVIHVAGTNGKGSSVAYLRAIFEAAGYKVHSYTSPHLLEFNERIVLAGEKIFDNQLFEMLERVRFVVAERHPGLDPGSHEVPDILQAKFQNDDTLLDPTFFEATTAAAFLAFSEMPADILLLETGLGGRLDATNIVPNPLLTILTPISYDHMPMLGPTLPIIAAEKACIIKRGIPCVISAQIEEVMDVFLSKCEEMGAEAIAYGYDFAQEKNGDSMEVSSLHHGSNHYPIPSLPGDHQILNATTIVAACDLLKAHFNITYEHICTGLRKVEWPGRLQKVKWNGKSQHIWLDGAHNTGAAQVLAIWMRENLKPPISMILGITKNRDALAFASFFKGIVERIYCVRVYSEPSSYSAEKLAELVGPSGIEAVACDDLEEAINEALSKGEAVVTGSLFLVADVLKLGRK